MYPVSVLAGQLGVAALMGTMRARVVRRLRCRLRGRRIEVIGIDLLLRHGRTEAERECESKQAKRFHKSSGNRRCRSKSTRCAKRWIGNPEVLSRAKLLKGFSYYAAKARQERSPHGGNGLQPEFRYLRR